MYLHDKDEFSTLTLPKQSIRGVLHDLTKVSLIQCITKSGPGHAAQDGQEYCFATVFPHFVVYGTNHIGPDEKKIAKIHFATDDGTTLFYDFDAFGFLLDARPFIEEIANANAHVHGRTIVTGPNPEILYFAGKREIFAADTVLGRVFASHNPRHSSLGGPSGVGLKNTIFVTIDFGNLLAFQESVARMFTVLRFLEMVAGRRQTILGLDLETQSRQQSSTILHVYWSMGPKDDPAGGEEKPHPSDVLIDAVRQPNEFTRVLSN
ncbi:MAG: hypothetical protein EPN47_05410 [Acidobacteria bacterium]|nr:MAG: hypothetical protein EPN47_05410 [Acidobacteriota bacterium]